MSRSDKSEKSPALLNEDGLAMLALEKTATDLHALAYPNPIYRAPNQDFTKPLVILSDRQRHKIESNRKSRRIQISSAFYFMGGLHEKGLCCWAAVPAF